MLSRLDSLCSLCVFCLSEFLLCGVAPGLCLVSGEVLVWRVGFRVESGAICQVEDLLTVRHSCWGIVGAFTSFLDFLQL